MPNFMDILAQLLNPNGINSAGGNRLAQAGMNQNQQDAGYGYGPMQAAPQAAPVAGDPNLGLRPPVSAPIAPQQAPAASYGYDAGGGGGLLGGIQKMFGGGGGSNSKGLNDTVLWLTKQGYDPGMALYIANDKQALQTVLREKMKRSERHTAVIGGKLVDTDSGEVIYEDSGNGDLFSGASVEGQALNGLVKVGKLTTEQAMQIGAGKTVINPADGSVIFLTPEGIVSQMSHDGTTKPLTADPAPALAPAPTNAPLPAPQQAAPIAPAPATSAVPPAASTNPGLIQLTPGKPGKVVTEAQQRNQSLYTVAAPELKRIEADFPALQSLYSQAANRMVPWGLENFATSPAYQRANNALTFMAQTFLYSVSGQAAPASEVEKIVRATTPMPGEDKSSVAQKLERVRTMVEAIRQAGATYQGGGALPPLPPSNTPPPSNVLPLPPSPGTPRPSLTTPGGEAPATDWKDWIKR